MTQLVLVIENNRPDDVSIGVSPDAQVLDKIVNDARQWVAVDRSIAMSDVLELYEQCSVRGWDGDEAEPIAAESVVNALRFITKLPVGLPQPEVCPEPDGEIAIEWYLPDRQCSVSIGSHSRVAYAARIGLEKRFHGTESFNGHIPKHLQLVLEEFTV